MTAYLDGYSGYSGVPEDAAAEILEKLMTHQQISSDEVAQILKRYGVCGEPEALQIAYRKKVGQRLIASLRDPYGRREVFSTGRQATIRRNTMDIKYIGRTEHRSHRLMTPELWMK